jgi:hypothetical protein
MYKHRKQPGQPRLPNGGMYVDMPATKSSAAPPMRVAKAQEYF